MSPIHEQRLPVARPDDPALGVHVLTEFLFCQRAGLLTWEKREPDPGQERDPHLNYLPDYFIREITEALEEMTHRVWCFLTWAPVALVAIGLAGWFGGPVLGLFLGLAAAFTLPVFWQDIRAMWKLNARRNLARQSGGAEPSRDLSSPRK